jgi:apolipoprotein D and lipocalin family protein
MGYKLEKLEVHCRGKSCRMNDTAPLKCMLLALLLFLSASCSAFNKTDMEPLIVVDYVDLNRYAGVWYEIARLPHRFQKGCVSSMATYTPLADDKLSVVNQCREGSTTGKVRSVKGVARVVDTQTNAKLKVSFFWPFYGKYWIIDLGSDYEYAVVGHPSRKYLWILSRTPEMDEGIYQMLLQRLEKQHYDTSKLIKNKT